MRDKVDDSKVRGGTIVTEEKEVVLVQEIGSLKTLWNDGTTRNVQR